MAIREIYLSRITNQSVSMPSSIYDVDRYTVQITLFENIIFNLCR